MAAAIYAARCEHAQVFLTRRLDFPSRAGPQGLCAEFTPSAGSGQALTNGKG